MLNLSLEVASKVLVLIESWAEDVEFVKCILGCDSVNSKLIMLEDVFRGKAPSTLSKRAFFARRPIGPCNLVLFVHHRLMRGEKSVHDSRIGAEPFVHCET